MKNLNNRYKVVGDRIQLEDGSLVNPDNFSVAVYNMDSDPLPNGELRIENGQIKVYGPWGECKPGEFTFGDNPRREGSFWRDD